MIVHVVFGEMGSGKNYTGLRLAQKHGIPFVDGDDFLPEDLRRKLDQGGILLKPEVSRYFNQHLIPSINELITKNENGFVLAQALYDDTHRKILNVEFECEFYWVRVSYVRHIKNLLTRPRRWGWIARMLLSKPFFQKPSIPHVVVKNG